MSHETTHVHMRLVDWDHECIYAEYVHQRGLQEKGIGSADYLAIIYAEWVKRNLCPQCWNDLDPEAQD